VSEVGLPVCALRKGGVGVAVEVVERQALSATRQLRRRWCDNCLHRGTARSGAVHGRIMWSYAAGSSWLWKN